MNYYILNGVPERKQGLEKHLKDRGILDVFNVHFVTDYTKDDQFVLWVHEFYSPHVSVGGVSGFIKLCKILDMFIETGHAHCMISDDDVVFIKDWKTHFDKIQFGFFNCMSLGVNFHVLPDGTQKFTGNIGGCECSVVSREFAQFFLRNIDFRQAADIVVSAMLISRNEPLVITPICQQTSILEVRNNNNGATRYEKDWITFIKTYKPSGLVYDQLVREFTEYSVMKHAVEDDFEKRFGIRISINNKQYIIDRFRLIRI